MSSIGSKVRLISLSNIHDLLNKVIDINSIGALRQIIRDIEAAENKLADEAAIRKGRVARLLRDKEILKVKITTTDENITLVLTDTDATNDHLATPLQVRLDGFNEDLTQIETDIQEETTTGAAFEQATGKLTGKKEEMIRNLKRLEGLERSAKAKEAGAEALAAAGAAARAEMNVDSVQRRLEERSDKANARFQRAMGGIEDSVDQGVKVAQANAAIAARRKVIEDAKAKQS